MTKVINLAGGPGIGKSTLAAELYARMKRLHYNVEMVREAAKEWAWDGREIRSFEQLSILGEQIKRESSLYKKVDYIITDSPVFLGAFYLDYKHDAVFMNRAIVDYYEFSNKKGVTFYNFLLPRKDLYDPEGRYETEDEAIDIDVAIYHYLVINGYMFEELEYAKKEEEIVANILKEVIRNG